MTAEEDEAITLFGVRVSVPRTADRQEPDIQPSNRGQRTMIFTFQGTPIVQEHDQGVAPQASVARHIIVDASPNRPLQESDHDRYTGINEISTGDIGPSSGGRRTMIFTFQGTPIVQESDADNIVDASPNRPLQESSGEDHNMAIDEISRRADMEAEEDETLTLYFGMQINFSRTAARESNISPPSRGQRAILSPQETLIVQERDQRGARQAPVADHIVDASPHRPSQEPSGDDNIGINEIRTSNATSFSRNEAEEVDTITLFGKRIAVPRTAARDRESDLGPSRGGQSTSLSRQETRIVQESDPRGAPPHASVTDNIVDISPNRPLQESAGEHTKGFEISTCNAVSFSRTADENKMDIAKSQKRKREISVVNEVEKVKGRKPPKRRIKTIDQDHQTTLESQKRKGKAHVSYEDEEPQKTRSSVPHIISTVVDRNQATSSKSPKCPSLNDTPQLPETIESNNGTSPVFLYRKRLRGEFEKHQFLITETDKVIDFLTEEERVSATRRGDGLEFSAVDPQGNVYKLNLRSYQRLQKLVISSSDWMKLITRNDAAKGDWIELWGSRCRGKLRLAVDIVKPKAAPSSKEPRRHG